MNHSDADANRDANFCKQASPAEQRRELGRNSRFRSGVELPKNVAHSRAHGKKWGARRVGVLKVRRASRCGALIFARRPEPGSLVAPNALELISKTPL